MIDQPRLYVDEGLFLGRTDEAIVAFQRAIELDPNWAAKPKLPSTSESLAS